jgi:hypothetical protein
MNALVDFVVRLFGDAIQMPGLFGEVALADPLSPLIIAVGTVFVVTAVAAMAYPLLGALGVPLPSLGSGPNEKIE